MAPPGSSRPGSEPAIAPRIRTDHQCRNRSPSGIVRCVIRAARNRDLVTQRISGCRRLPGHTVYRISPGRRSSGHKESERWPWRPRCGFQPRERALRGWEKTRGLLQGRPRACGIGSARGRAGRIRAPSRRGATRSDAGRAEPVRTRRLGGLGGWGEDPPWPWASRGACMGGGGLGGRTGAPGGSTAGACKRGLGRQVRGSRRRCGPENRAVPPAPDARLLARRPPGRSGPGVRGLSSPRGCVPWDHSSPTTARPDWTRRRPRPLRCPRPPLLRPQLPPSGNAFPAPSRGIWPGSLVVGLER